MECIFAVSEHIFGKIWTHKLNMRSNMRSDFQICVQTYGQYVFKVCVPALCVQGMCSRYVFQPYVFNVCVQGMSSRPYVFDVCVQILMHMISRYVLKCINLRVGIRFGYMNSWYVISICIGCMCWWYELTYVLVIRVHNMKWTMYS